MRVSKLAAIALLASETVKGFLMQGRACSACLSAGQRACLGNLDGTIDYTTYTCCTANSYAKDCWDRQAKNRYCTSEITVAKTSFVALKDQDLRQWTCPMRTALYKEKPTCDSAVDVPVSSSSEFVMRSKQWDFQVPTADAADWNCKYKISLDTTKLDAAKGFLMVQVEAYGFEETLTVMSQPAGAKNIVDFISNTDANGVRVY